MDTELAAIIQTKAMELHSLYALPSSDDPASITYLEAARTYEAKCDTLKLFCTYINKSSDEYYIELAEKLIDPTSIVNDGRECAEMAYEIDDNTTDMDLHLLCAFVLNFPADVDKGVLVEYWTSQKNRGLLADNLFRPYTIGKPVDLSKKQEVIAERVLHYWKKNSVPIVIYGKRGCGKSVILDSILVQPPFKGMNHLICDISSFLQNDKLIPAQDIAEILDNLEMGDHDVIILDNFDYVTEMDTVRQVLHQAMFMIRSGGKRMVIMSDSAYDRDRIIAATEQIEVPPMTISDVTNILNIQCKSHPFPVDLDIIPTIIELGEIVNHHLANPQKTLNVFNSISEYSSGSIGDEDITTYMERAKYIVPTDTLSNLTTLFKQELFGQDTVIDEVVSAINSNQLGLRPIHQPKGIMVFLGSTGTGKTELAKLIAKHLLGSPDLLLRVDMSEFKEPHSVSKITGPPPGYVGFSSTGGSDGVFGSLKDTPRQVVLLDEIEKGHPAVFDLFLQMFDNGRISLSNGSHIDFSQTIIIMTSNLGVSKVNKTTLGFGSVNVKAGASEELERQNELRKNGMLKALGEHFRPEFLGRVQNKVVFNDLRISEYYSIIHKEFKLIEKRLYTRGFRITIDRGLDAFIARRIINNGSGARYVNDIVQKIVSTFIASNILDGKIVPRTPLLISENKKKTPGVISADLVLGPVVATKEVPPTKK